VRRSAGIDGHPPIIGEHKIGENAKWVLTRFDDKELMEHCYEEIDEGGSLRFGGITLNTRTMKFQNYIAGAYMLQNLEHDKAVSVFGEKSIDAINFTPSLSIGTCLKI
jgi:hypothetical protein